MVLLGQSNRYCFGKGDFNPAKEKFFLNKHSRAEDYWREYIQINESSKDDMPSGPSWGWLYAALNGVDTFKRKLASMPSIETQILIASAGADTVVDNSSDSEIASYLSAKHQTYVGSLHSIQHDSEEVRTTFFIDISNFLAES